MLTASSCSRSAPAAEITQLLQHWSAGLPDAHEELISRVYAELRRVAASALGGERAGHTLQPTALVHETYLQLFEGDGLQGTGFQWRSRDHFLAVASRVMRRILVDYARQRAADKRGGGRVRVPLVDSLATSAALSVDALSLHRALETLAVFAPSEVRVVELRYFAGLTIPQTGRVLGLSPRTVVRLWRRARAWLLTQVAAAEGSGERP